MISELERLKSFYAVLSKINHLIVRSSDPMTLFEQTCRLAVEDGRFRMAWVGRKNPDTQKVDVVAFSGVVEDYLEKINIDLADEVRGSGPTGLAVKTGAHVLALDIENNASMGPWRDDARRMGIRSSGAFPINLNGEVWGALTLYSDEVGFFETDVLRLLDELALDLAFALEVAEKEAALHSLEHQLFQAQKLESLGTLASGIAHDFNNLLAIILGQVTLLETLPPDPERLQKSLDRIRVAGNRGTALVRQMLTLARKAPARLEPINLNTLADETLVLVAETFPPSIARVFHGDPSLPLVLGDPTQVQQVLLNLCVNARDAMPEGGTLRVETQGLAEAAVLRVADTGVGMDETTKNRIFEPFFTTKAPGQGTGLGLSMVFGIVEGHGGTIRVDSKLGRGTTFECRFPLTR